MTKSDSELVREYLATHQVKTMPISNRRRKSNPVDVAFGRSDLVHPRPSIGHERIQDKLLRIKRCLRKVDSGLLSDHARKFLYAMKAQIEVFHYPSLTAHQDEYLNGIEDLLYPEPEGE
jgi:hypothetical protein